MAITYHLPQAVRLQFSRAGGAVDTITTAFQAGWRRSFRFFDLGYADGLKIVFGSQNGNVVATDLQLLEDYVHDFTTHAAFPVNGYWLPAALVPVDINNNLETVDITVYFDAAGAAGTPVTDAFKCLARPERIAPQLITQGANAAVVAYQWDIINDTAPDTTLGT